MIKDRMAKAVSRLWTGKCDVINYTDTKDENGITKHDRRVIAEAVPCRLSYENDSLGTQTRTTDNISQTIKLFISNDIEIKPGSEITVTQNGITRSYVSSGIPSVYTAHQEVNLVDKEEFA